MNRSLPALLLSLLVLGCATKPTRTTEVRRPDTQSQAYDRFVEQRTRELERMGGPFADRAVAEQKARDEAKARYGDVPPEYSTTWSWGGDAGKKEAQREVNSTLEKMDRDAPRR